MVKTKEIFNAPAKQHVGQEGAEDKEENRSKKQDLRVTGCGLRPPCGLGQGVASLITWTLCFAILLPIK